MIPNNPTTSPRTAFSAKFAPCNAEEVRNIEAELLRTNDLTALVAMFLALEGGARLREIAALEVVDINFKIKTAYLKATGRRSRDRVCYFGDKAAHYLQQYLAVRTASADVPYVLVSDRGEKLHPRVISQRFAKAAKQAGAADTGFHRLRRTFAIDLAAAGVPVNCIAQMGGWRSFTETRSYIRLSPERLRGLYSGARRKVELA